MAAASCTLPCSLRLNFSRSLLIVRSVSETRSSASTSSSLFILTEENLFNKPAFVKADIRLKYQAICCSINQSVLYNISGWCRLLNSIFEKPHFLLVSSRVRHTFRRYFFAFWKKGISFLCSPKNPSKAVHLASKGLVVRIFAWGPTLNDLMPPSISSCSHQRQILLPASICVCLC